MKASSSLMAVGSASGSLALLLAGCAGKQHALPPQPSANGLSGKNGVAVAVLGDTERELDANLRSVRSAGQTPRFVVVENKGKKHRFTVFAQIVRTDKFIIVRGYKKMYVFSANTARVFYKSIDVTSLIPTAQVPPKLISMVRAKASASGEYLAAKPTVHSHLDTAWASLKDPWQVQPDYTVADGYIAPKSSARHPEMVVCHPSFTGYTGESCYYYYWYYPVPYYPYSTPPSVTIDSADIASNNISVSVGGGGNLTVTASISGTATQTLYSGSVADYSTVNFPFYTSGGTSLTRGEWTELDATVSSPGGTASDAQTLSFYVMGTVRHSQYNSPDEGSCPGSPIGVTLYNPSGCAASPGSYRSVFASQVQINGSGRPLAGGFCSIENGCGHAGDSSAFDYPISQPMGACSQPVSNGTVAAPLGLSNGVNLQCNDQLLEISGSISTVKTITDRCPACNDVSTYNGTFGHIDDYTTESGCTGVVDAGNFVTIRINR